MDQRYFLHVEDLDLCFAMSRTGGTVLFVPQVSLIHYRSTSDASEVLIEWHKARGFTQYFRKNFTGLCPTLFLKLVNVLIWGYFVLKLTSFARNAVSGLPGRLARAFGRGVQIAEGPRGAAENDGRNGRAA